MDETSHNLLNLLGLVVIVFLGVFSVKVFIEWLNEQGDIPPYLTQIESRVIKSNGETGRAIFATKEDGNETLLVFDKGNGFDIPPVRFHPKKKCLISHPNGRAGLGIYTGPPIDIGKYQDLPWDRRGFDFSD